ncbi:F-box domain-containing protein [Pochonia chlamydosporia 170]|uniref:F-box domain-containing protein n=1 Tax=Pochonia chlamydosporia 170 TaxID=1380566 RepID=A0A179FE53_METCM|nr:F-box domain-containing protein [Pochonia chlamydosporia 170]OAQ63590.2 F-box domain-containing protein [Pochonia chlamydosporia 170]
MAGFAASRGKRPAEPADDSHLETNLASNSSSPASSSPVPSASSLQPAPKRQAPSPAPTSASSQSQLRSSESHIHDLLPIVPTSVTTSSSNYGRINAENETNLGLLKSVPKESESWAWKMQPTYLDMGHDIIMILQALVDGSLTLTGNRIAGKHSISKDVVAGSLSSRHNSNWSANTPLLFMLPPELIDCVLSHLSATDLLSVAATCRQLHKQAVSDFHWMHCIQRNVPGLTLTNPGPCNSFRELYAAHDPIWFLPKYKIWFCDRDLTGKLIIVRFDPRRGCIEGYQLLAVSNRNTFEHWPADNQVIIHGFEPQVKLHLDKPVLQFDVQDRQEVGDFATRPGANRFAAERPMTRGNRSDPMFSNFLLTRPLEPEVADEKLAADYPYDNVWPPPTIPARHHVSGARSGQAVIDLSPDDRPRSRGEVSDQTFRIRQWMQMPGTPSPPSLIGGQAGGFAGMVQVLNGLNGQENVIPVAGAAGIHIGEEIITYSTLDPVLYTPTVTKPWRGIWVGDYSGHGCEFLLINQPDDPPITDVELGLVREAEEADGAWEKRRREAHMYRGRLEAIKLTGDPNVPRGEYTFVADDLGPGGYVGIATDPPFAGTRVVKSKGHVAATGFVRDKYIESQLLLIGPNRLAQYWVGFGHISFFERVQVDSLIVP